MRFIADERMIYHSPYPQDLYCYTPWLEHAFNGRIIASFDVSGSALKLEKGPRSGRGDYSGNQLRIYVSDDHGATWRETGRLPMLHARVIPAGKCLYAIGHAGKLLVSKSTDNGETWGEPVCLEDQAPWHQSACAYERIDGRIYITMEQIPNNKAGAGDPVLMCADENDDLTNVKNWRFSNIAEFQTIAKAAPPLGTRHPGAWLESNVVLERNPESRFYGQLLVFLRTLDPIHPDTAAMLVAGEREDGTLYLERNTEPYFDSVYLPFPGGYMKFHILWDEKSRLYWMIASRARKYSMIAEDARYMELNCFQERRQLELFYSGNAFDWCSAGVVACGETEHESRHYASILIDGDDMLVLSRSGDKNAKNTHDTDMITLHRIKDFRTFA